MQSPLENNPSNPFLKKSFRQWYSATTLLAISTSTTIAVTLLLVDITKNTAIAGMLSGLILFIQLCIGPIGGGLADVTDRRTLLRRALMTALAANLTTVISLLLFFTYEELHGGWLSFLVVFSLIVSGAAAGIADPSIDASARSLITPAEFPRAMSAEQARSSTLHIVGSPASGAMYSTFPALPFILRIVCDAGFLLTLQRIKRGLGPTGTEALDSKLKILLKSLSGYKESFAFIQSKEALRRIQVAAPLINLMVFSGTSWAVLNMSHSGAGGLISGITVSGFAIGALLGSSITPFLTDRFTPGILAIAGLSWMTIIFALLFIYGGNPWALFVLAVLGMAPSPALNGGLFGHVFAETPGDMQGRVMATFSLVAGLSAVVAPVFSGWAVQEDLNVLLGFATCSVGIVGILILASSSAVRNMKKY
ncbi:H+ Antiporter protein [Dermatophilus congolensis]|uniref:H+ Antiporter protein n=1 Tax=Dermatophilus congolensis TaxID=1863 RepID=A0A239VN31_9MICO|nr:MFS transporter [Dermatophilus congolensis]SNV23695.1 H+ Antiporter protein [Dermatophilus congolensis]